MPWIDNARGYAALIVLESTAALGTELRVAAKPVLDAVFDGTGSPGADAGAH
jgi:hypothetical protein